MAGEYDLSVILRVLDRASKPLQKIGDNFKKLTKPVNVVNARVQALGVSIKKVGDKMGAVGRGMALKLTLPLTIMGGIITKASIGYETAFTGVRKTVEATEPQFKKLKKGLMDLALVIPVSTRDLFGVAEAAGQLGQKQEDIVSFTKTMADLGATTNMTAQEAAMELARFANVVGVVPKDFDRLGSVIVDLGNNMAANEQEITNMAGRLKTAGKLAKLTAPQIFGLAAGLTSIGINAEAGGTAFSQVMLKISGEIGKNNKNMRGFAWVTGKTVKEFEELWKKDAAEALLQFTEGLATVEKRGMTAAQALDKLGMDGARMAMSLLGAAESGDKFRGALNRSSKAWKDGTALAEEANKKYKTTESRLIMAGNRAEQMAVSFGDILKKALLSVVEYLKPLVIWLEKLSPKTKLVILVVLGLVAAMGPLLMILGPIASGIGSILIAVAMLSGTGMLAVLGSAFLALLAPIGIVVLAVAGIGVAIYMIIKHWDRLKAVWESWSKFVVGLTDWVINTIKNNWEGIKSFFKDLGGFIFDSLFESFRMIVEAVGGQTVDDVINRWKTIIVFFKDLGGFISESLAQFVDIAVKHIEEKVNDIKFFFTDLWGWLKEGFEKLVNFLGELNLFGDVQKNLSESLDKIIGIWNKVKSVFGGGEETPAVKGKPKTQKQTDLDYNAAVKKRQVEIAAGMAGEAGKPGMADFHEGGRLNLRNDEGYFKGQRGEEVVTQKNLKHLEKIINSSKPGMAGGVKELIRTNNTTSMQKSQTEVLIKVSSDSRSTATIEKVQKKKGDANVSAATLGYIGAY